MKTTFEEIQKENLAQSVKEAVIYLQQLIGDMNKLMAYEPPLDASPLHVTNEVWLVILHLKIALRDAGELEEEVEV